MFQSCLAIEFIFFIIAARFRRFSFEAFERLDEKCGFDENYINKLETRATRCAIFTLISFIGDVIGLALLKLKISEILLYSFLYSAQDAELIFFSMIVEAVNLRLSKLNDVSPVFGCKVYRHVLMTTAWLNEEYANTVVLVFSVILGTTVMYFCIAMLAITKASTRALMYLVWRELKVFFCLWRVCYTSYNSERICQQLASHLANKLALDPLLSKTKNPGTYKTIQRWFSTILAEKPSFVSNSVLSLGLSVPIRLIDISVNYVLIIVQIYVAYN